MLETDIVFVFGALRSGTTLFRLMLDGHEQISNPGEVDFLFDHLHRDATHRTGWRYDLRALQADRIFQDRGLHCPPGTEGLDLLADFLEQLKRRGGTRIVTLNLHRHAGDLATLIPGARVLRLLRDPRDVARSSIGMGWAGTLYHGVDPWLGTEMDWKRARDRFEPDHVLSLKYETLLADPVAELERVCAFLGASYSPAMLDYPSRSTYGPPDVSLTEQWKHKLTPSEIALVEGKARPIMEELGYRPSGPGHVPGGFEKVWLDVRNKQKILAFRMHRFGQMNVILEIVTRKLGLPAHRRLQARFNTITRQYLK